MDVITKVGSVESIDSGMYIQTGKGFGYPPVIFTDSEYAANLPDSETEGPQIINYMGEYCEDCITKWSRCICRSESDWDDDHNYAVRTQTESPSIAESNEHPIPSNWSDQENVWSGKAYEKSTVPQPRYWSIPVKEDDNDSDWNDNLYPYMAKSQSQVPSRQPLPDGPKE